MESALRGYACPSPPVDKPASAPAEEETKSADTEEAGEGAGADAPVGGISEARVMRQMNGHFSDILDR